MAPLTWKEVSAPTFSNVSESQRLAAALLSNGIGAASSALGDWKKSRDDAASSQYLQDISRYTDAASLGEALRSGTLNPTNGGTVSTEALKIGMGRQGDLLSYDTTRLNNAAQSETNTQTAWKDSNTRAYEAARPDAVKAATEIRGQYALGTPEGTARAQSLEQQYAPIFAKAGMTVDQAMTMNDNHTKAATSGLDLKTAYDKANLAKTEADQVSAAKDIVAGVVRTAGSQTQAVKAVQSLDGLRPEVMTRAIEQIKSQPDLFAAPADPQTTILNQRTDEQLGRDSISYRNQGSIRSQPMSDQLTSAIAPVLSGLGVRMQVFSGGQNAEGEGGERTGSTRHDHGNAADVEFYAQDGHRLDPKNKADIPLLTEIVRQGKARGISGWGEGADYMGSGRVHLGFGDSMVWGAGGHKENAPQWLKDAYFGNGSPDLGQAPPSARPTSASPQVATDDASAAIQRAIASAAMPRTSDQNQQLYDDGLTQMNRGQQLLDEMTADSAHNMSAPLLNAVVNPGEDRNLSKAAVTEKLAAALADKQPKDASGTEKSDGKVAPDLTLGQLTDVVQTVMDKYHVPANIASALIQESVDQNTYGTRWAFGERGPAWNRIDSNYHQLFDDQGRPTKAVEQLARQRNNDAQSSQIKQLSAQVQQAQQEYFNAQARVKDHPGTNLNALRLQYEALKGQLAKVIDRADRNPLTRANSNALTGR
jgi:hypothetical protein